MDNLKKSFIFFSIFTVMVLIHSMTKADGPQSKPIPDADLSSKTKIHGKSLKADDTRSDLPKGANSKFPRLN